METETKLTEQELEQMVNNYSTRVVENFYAPVLEVQWLVKQLLDSKHRESIIELLKTFK